jgi:predicted ATPase/serine phosphatase RsbU (regulator of sigma subunit)/tRNA A-37 threonylcarbamoyl transferase component Bud32
MIRGRKDAEMSMGTMTEGFTPTAKLRDLAQAALYRGHRNADQAPVLLKIPTGDRPSAAQLARLRHEHSILRSLTVPGVVKPLGLERVGGTLALVLEDAGDRTLDLGADAHPMELGAFLQVAISMTRVVEAVHRHHIIHKDIKPVNFMMNGGPDVTLVDFGVATRLSLEDRRASSVNRLEGTLAYMSPEQTGRMNRVLDRRTDLYSLGVTFYELLTGLLPFRASDPLELVHSHIARAPVPPHAVVATVPAVVSDIVMKLLSKNAEDRYQDVAGLRADLERCRESLLAGAAVAAFTLGERDFSDELRIPQKLYGREADSMELLSTFDRARRGAAELLLISGYSGVGKSALVNEIQKQIVKGGRFVAGKFDQLGRRVPYLPITHACGELLRSILTEPPEALDRWRQKILAAVGPNGQVLIDLVPELAIVIGPQPKVQNLGPSESQRRFEQTFQSFLQVFTSAEHPLAFFLDDLQWADPASLRLIHLLLTSPHRGHLLVIGAYRENEVDPMHPLSLALADLGKAGVPTHEMKLRPLGLYDVGQLLADTLGRDRADPEVEPLARLVLRKTHGNPFFLNQFVTDLHKQGLLAWDGAAHRWSWSLGRIEDAKATDNVIDFMITKLRRLGPESQRALSLAACIGHTFDRRTLAVVSEQQPAAVAALLWEALREGLIVPVDANQGYLHGGDGEAGDAILAESSEEEMNPAYRFLHDRVQQAAYALIDDKHRQEVHLRIGRLMVAGAGAGGEDRLFDVVNHMNMGAALVTDHEERRTLARMNLHAGRRARDAIAYGMAIKFLGTCEELLGDGAWQSDYDLAYPACLTRAECEFVGNNVDEAFRLLDTVVGHARTTLDAVAALKLRMLILSNLNRMEEAITTGLEAARRLGMEFPGVTPDVVGPAIGAEMGALGAALAERSVESLIDLPVASDPEAVALLDVLYGIIPAAAQTNTALMVLTVAKAVNLALHRGNSRVSSYFYICYGMVLTGGGDLETGYRMGQVGMRLNERMNVVAVDGANHFVFSAFVSFWRRPLAESLEIFAQGLKVGLAAGDYLHAAYCITFLGLYRLYIGDDLDEVSAELASKAELLARTGNVVNQRAVKLVGQLIASFKGETARRGSLESEGFDAGEFERAVVESGNRFLISTYYLHAAIARYFAGDFTAALADLEKAVPAVPPELTRAEISFYTALARAAALHADESGERKPLLAELAKDEELLRGWAASSPGTFGHRHALVAAELAALGSDPPQALSLYDRAIALAQQNRAALLEGLGNELCARFAARQGWAKVASVYRQEARAAYSRCGATAKVQEIAPEVSVERAGTAEVRAEQLDALSFVKASQAISTEIVLSKLIGSLMRLVIEQAGAERGYLILQKGGELWVEGVAGTGETAAFHRFPLEAGGSGGRPALPRSLIGYAQRTKEKVLLTGADDLSMFAADPYFAAQRPRSLLCMPMIRQGDLVGLLYLENNLTGDAFSSDRVQLLEVLSSQAAVSLENATLYDELEKRVEDRTRELEASLRTIKENQAQLIEAERRTAIAHYEREMAIARQIQTSILPKRLAVPGLEIAASMVTASEVGGDYYDLEPTDDGGCWLGIGDVSGHGLDAGLMMLMIQSSLGTLMRRDPDADPSSLVCQMNRMLHENIRVRLGRDDFATLSLFRFYPDGRYVVAGAHEDVVVWRARTGKCEQIPTEGGWIGIRERAETLMPNRANHLEQGDLMILYTDGITEARDDTGEQLGIERLSEALASLHGEPVATICSRILEQAKSWANVQDDDQTLVVLRRQ